MRPPPHLFQPNIAVGYSSNRSPHDSGSFGGNRITRAIDQVADDSWLWPVRVSAMGQHRRLGLRRCGRRSKAACTAAGLIDPLGRPGPPRRRCASTASTPTRCIGYRPTSSRPNSSSATACPPKAPANATLCSAAQSSSPPPTTHPRLRARLIVEQQLIDDATTRASLLRCKSRPRRPESSQSLLAGCGPGAF